MLYLVEHAFYQGLKNHLPYPTDFYSSVAMVVFTTVKEKARQSCMGKDLIMLNQWCHHHCYTPYDRFKAIAL